MIVGLMFVTPLFIVGYKNTVKSSIIFGKRKIDSPSIRGKWTKPKSKSKVSDTISTM